MQRIVLVTMVVAALTANVASAQQQASAQPVPTVAVFDFNAFSLTPGEDAAAVGRGLASMIATELASRPQVRVVDRQEIDRLVEKRQLALSGRMDDGQAVQLGQLLGAQYVVVGSVALQKDQARIDLRLLDVETGVVAKADRRQGKRDDFLEMAGDIADRFTRDLKMPAHVAQAGTATVPVAAAVAYSRGLDYEQRGMLDRAASMYQQALDLFSGYGDARQALQRVRSKGE